MRLSYKNYDGLSYEDCINFIENELRINLFNFQKEIIKCFFEGKEVRTARGIGRSMCANAFAKYIAYAWGEGNNDNFIEYITHLNDRNDYFAEPDIIIPYQIGVKNGLWSEEQIESIRIDSTQEQFEREFCSK